MKPVVLFTAVMLTACAGDPLGTPSTIHKRTTHGYAQRSNKQMLMQSARRAKIHRDSAKFMRYGATKRSISFERTESIGKILQR
jgi:hypothetical protein